MAAVAVVGDVAAGGGGGVEEQLVLLVGQVDAVVPVSAGGRGKGLVWIRNCSIAFVSLFLIGICWHALFGIGVTFVLLHANISG